jgi:uncharacterized protein YndB with AHSA1/START domain
VVVADADTTSVAVDIDAAAEVVWALVSDLTRMSEWSPETTKVEWVDGATGPAVGAKFRGSNRSGVRRWSTTCTIVACDPPRELAWDVTTVFGLKIARWRYQIESTGDRSCRVTESTVDQRTDVVSKLLGRFATGVKDRREHNAAGMRVTLERIKLTAERL